MSVLADEVVGYWPGDPESVRGKKAYTSKVAELLAALSDLRLKLRDSATVGQGTGPSGPFTMRGLDRVRARDGVVVENVIRCEPAILAKH